MARLAFQNSGDHGSRVVRTMTWKQRGFVLFIMGHLFLVATSLLSTVSPSGWMSQILAVGNPYLRATHFGVDARPVYLAHGNPNEQPLRLRVNDDEELLPNTIAGAGSDDRQQRWLATVGLLAEQEQPSLVAELVMPVLQRTQWQRPSDAIQDPMVRLIREPTILSDVLDDQAPPLYEAKIINNQGEIAVVRLLPPRLTATAIGGTSQ